MANLTARENEVMAHVAQGLHDKEIAALLCISPETVRSHMKSILIKSDSRNRTSAAVWYLRQAVVGAQPSVV